MPARLSGAKEILILLLLGVAGQSWDSYSDLGLSYRMAVGKTYNGKFNNIQSITHIYYIIKYFMSIYWIQWQIKFFCPNDTAWVSKKWILK